MARTPEELATLPSEHESLWIEETSGTRAPVLPGDITVDTAIVGAGVAGIVAADELSEAGHNVALLEANRILEGVTGHTTAKLTSQHGLIYDTLLDRHGPTTAQRYADANEAAIEVVADRVETDGIACNFHRAPAYTYVEDEDRVDEIHAEVEAAQELGLPARFVDDVPVPVDVAGAVRFDDQALFHPRRYLLALAEALNDGANAVHERTRVKDVHDGDPCRIETESHEVTADQVVLATHFPIVDRAGYFARMRPTKSYVLAARLNGEEPEGMHYHDASPIFSIRPRAGRQEELVLFTGQNHRTGEADEADRYEQLEQTVRQRFDVDTIDYRWSTQDFVSLDEMPFVGPVGPGADNVYAATGFGGWGMTNGIAAGRMLAEAVLGDPPEELAAFDPARAQGTSPSSVLSHNAHAAKEFVADRIRRYGKATEIDLEPGEGEIIRHEGEPVAAYRDEDGDLHTNSAICTHMGCEVKWNASDETFDCPCHGSRFGPEGEVVDGPAVDGLDEGRL